jgi:hypothetical protein
MKGFLCRQGKLILDKPSYAFISTILLVSLPFTQGVALTVICLVTLRKGYLLGSKLLAIALLTLGLIGPFFYFSNELMDSVLILTLGYASASLLRLTVSLQITASILLLISMLGIVIANQWLPQLIRDQFNIFLAMVKLLDNSTLQSFLSNAANHPFMISYVFGLKVFTLDFSIISSLLLARYIQSLLFYPGGFKQEILAFRASSFSVLMIFILAIGIYHDNTLAVAGLPIATGYLVASGLSLMFNLLANKTKRALLIVLIPMIVLPYIVLPAYALFGSLDSVFNFRLRLQSGRIR